MLLRDWRMCRQQDARNSGSGIYTLTAKLNLVHVFASGLRARRLILRFGNKNASMWQRCFIVYEAPGGAKIASYL